MSKITPGPNGRGPGWENCELCLHAVEHGWWGTKNTTHCRLCHATWGMATRTMHCVQCHETFTTPSNCDRHQAGTKADPGWKCRPPEMVGLEQIENAYGTKVWQLPGDGLPFGD
jgi:hypothetical protein